MNIVYLTDVSLRSIRINNGSIKLKKTSPKILSAKSEKIKLIIQALKELGQENISSKIKDKIEQLLLTVDKDLVMPDVKLAPQWIAKIIKELIK